MKLHRRTLLAATLATPALAQTAAWPNRPLRLVVPFPPGGATDAVGRLTGSLIAQHLGQQVVIENRGGAGGNLGAELAAKAEPDGYTLLITTISAAAMGPHLYPRLGYDPVKDLIPVAQSCHVCNGVLARPDLPVATLRQALDLARQRPGQLTSGSPGNGTSGHLVAEYLNFTAGVSMQHVPYRGTAPLMTDLLGGRLDLVHDNLPGYLPAIRDGKAKLLAVTSPARWFAAPEAPTVAEAANLPGFSAMIWWGVQVPTGTPAPHIARIAEAVTTGFALPEARDRLRQLGIEPAPLGTAAFTAHVAAEYRKWGEVVRQAGIRAD